MADVRPFRGLRYTTSAVGDLGAVICPPYDIISLTDEESLRRRSRYNAVSLELREEKAGEPHDEGRYERAAGVFKEWQGNGIIETESVPAIYVVEEKFNFQNQNRTRLGLTVIVRLEEFEKGIVMPHEFTTPGPKADRLALMKAGNANFSPIMSLFRDPDGAIRELLYRATQDQPSVNVAPEGQSTYKMWAITDSGILSDISSAMSDKQIFVADGHHRYETALQYRDDLEAAEGPIPENGAARFMMMTLLSMDDPGLLVLPYHRIVGGLSSEELVSLKKGLGEAFELETIDIPARPSDEIAGLLETVLDRQPDSDVVTVVYGLETGVAHLLTLREAQKPPPDSPSLEKCEMWLLHQRGIRPPLGEEREAESIAFVHDATEAVESVRSGRSQVAFLLRPLPMSLFEEVVSKGERLPPKSTYFYPKLATGLVINSLEGELD